MLEVFRRSLQTGIVTTRYPDGPDPMPAGARGTPELIAERCRGHAACAAVCPTGAIDVLPASPGAANGMARTGAASAASNVETLDAPRIWQIDYGRCVFCGLCAEVCPTKPIKALIMSEDYELGSYSRDTQILRVDEMYDGVPIEQYTR